MPGSTTNRSFELHCLGGRIAWVCVLVFVLLGTLVNAQVRSVRGLALADAMVNGVALGTIEFTLDRDGLPEIPVPTVLSLLGNVARPAVLRRISQMGEFVTVKELLSLGVILDYDPAALQLSFTVSPAAMAPVILGAAPRVLGTGETIFPVEPFSAQIGSSLRTHLSGAEGNPRTNEADFDPAFRLFGTVSEAGVDVGDSPQVWTRLRNARTSYDFPQAGARVALGTLEPQNSFAPLTPMVGLSLARISNLPFNPRSKLSPLEEIRLDNTADVTVEINGIIVRRLSLPPGAYLLSDLSLDTGLNTVTVRVLEAGRPARSWTVGVAFDSAILPQGEWDYDLDLGLDRPTLSQWESVAKVAFGVAPTLELGGNANAEQHGLSGGSSLLWASPVGSLTASEEVSWPFDGYAASLDWRLSVAGNRSLPKLGAGVSYRSPSLSAPADTLQVSAQVSQALPGNVGSLGVYQTATFGTGTLERVSSSVGLFFPLFRSTALSISGGEDWQPFNGWEPRVSATFSWVGDGATNLQYHQDLLRQREELEYSSPWGKEGTFQLGLQGRDLFVPDSAAGGVNVSSSYAGEAFGLSGSGSYHTEAQPRLNESNLSLEATGTVFYAGGHVGLSRTLGDAFMLVVPDSSIGKDTVELQSPDGPVVRSEGGEPKVFPGLLPYNPYEATVDMPGSAPDRRPVPEKILVEPAYHSATIVAIKAAPTLAVRGYVVNQAAIRQPGVVGEIFLLPNRVRVGTTFSDATGKFEFFGLEPGEYLVKWENGTQSRFNLADEEAGVVDIGTVGALTAPKEASK